MSFKDSVFKKKSTQKAIKTQNLPQVQPVTSLESVSNESQSKKQSNAVDSATTNKDCTHTLTKRTSQQIAKEITEQVGKQLAKNVALQIYEREKEGADDNEVLEQKKKIMTFCNKMNSSRNGSSQKQMSVSDFYKRSQSICVPSR